MSQTSFTGAKRIKQVDQAGYLEVLRQIYTHSLAGAQLGKECVKEHIEASEKTFAGRFDTFMQQ